MAIGATRYGSGIEINAEHLDDIRHGLAEYAPTVKTALDREITSALKEVGAEAGGVLHPGPGGGAGKYNVRRRKGGILLENRDRGAAISEFAGSVNPQGSTPRGKTLIETLNAAYGRPGRIAWAAWDRRKEQTDARIAGAIATAERVLDTHLGRL